MNRNRATKIVTMLLVAVLIIGAPTASAVIASKQIEVKTGVNIYIDDNLLNPTDVNGQPVDAFIYNGTTYLPVRAISEALGKDVYWEGSTYSVYIGEHWENAPTMLWDLDYFTGKYFDEYFHIIEEGKDNLGNPQPASIAGWYNVGYDGTEYTRNAEYDNVYKVNGDFIKMTGTLYRKYDYRNSGYYNYVRIYGDGELLYEAEMNGVGMEPIEFSVDLTGVLELRVETSIDYTCGLANPRLWTGNETLTQE